MKNYLNKIQINTNHLIYNGIMRREDKCSDKQWNKDNHVQVIPLGVVNKTTNKTTLGRW